MVVAYEFSELDELVLAYATSIHKAQGSEYPVVIIPILIGTKKALAIAIHNNKPRMRYTLLKQRLTSLSVLRRI